MHRPGPLRTSTILAVGLAGAALLAAGAAGTSQADAASSTRHPTGMVAARAQVRSVSAIGPDDVWTVGYTCTADSNCGSQADSRPAAQHWDGTSWHDVAVPLGPGQPDGDLLSVDARTSTDVWAVGWTTVGPLIEHWDGTAWTSLRAPGRLGTLNDVSAVAADDVWAVGGADDSQQVDRTLIEHFDGTRWRVSRAHRPGPGQSFLRSVAAISPNDVWAVGVSATHLNGSAGLVEHWDGSRWRRVSTEDPTYEAGFVDVAAVSAADVWAVSSVDGHGLVEHWDGQGWAAEPTPAPGLASSLYGVSAASATDVWAVGQWQSSTHPDLTEPLILHWDGASWQQVAVAGQKGNRDALWSISADGADDAWATGEYGRHSRTFLRHWDGSSWS